MSNDLTKLREDLLEYASNEKAIILSRFFKTGVGQYGEGDKFLGVVVPDSRKIVKKYSTISLSKIDKLIKSEFHEERLVAILILVEKYKVASAKASADQRKEICEFYLAHTKNINNWDLVDLSAPRIVGDFY